ncbi:MAG: AAA family ATPase [Gaiellaceae bacterium]
MIVRSARVSDFKSITDTDEVTFDEAVTCLVGKNESGKTAFLEAVYRINPVPTGHPQTFDGLRDFPRSRWALEKGDVPPKQPISVTFELTDEDVAAIEEEFGKKVIDGRLVTRSRTYGNETSVSVGQTDELVAMRHRLDLEEVDPKLADGCKTFADLVPKLEALDATEVPVAAALATEFASYDFMAELRKEIASRYPRFLYFDQYSVMPGRVSIPQLQAGGELTSGERTALALLKLAGAETAAFNQADYEARKAELEAASNAITKEVFDYWSQNKDLRVELDLDFNAPATAEGHEPPFLEIRIQNLRHGVSLNFGERSAGFVWFFSFLVAFSEYRNESSLVLLLDEPGLGLHAAAQLDLLRYIEERLAPHHQVVYSTHSPFMVDPTELQRVRTVEDVDPGGTTISEDVLATSAETIFPLQAALGYDLAQTLFVGPDNLVVEGPADYLYLTVLSDRLRELDRTSLDPRWVIVPVGGLDKIPTFVALLGAQLNVAVVMDSASGGSQKIDSLVKRGIIEKKKVIPLNSITSTNEADIEDMFDEALYLQLLKDAGISVTKSKLKPGNRIVPRVEQALGGPFDHYRPARHLLEKQVDLLPNVDEPTLARFEDLFTRVNSLLS